MNYLINSIHLYAISMENHRGLQNSNLQSTTKPSQIFPTSAVEFYLTNPNLNHRAFFLLNNSNRTTIGVEINNIENGVVKADK